MDVDEPLYSDTCHVSREISVVFGGRTATKCPLKTQARRSDQGGVYLSLVCKWVDMFINYNVGQ